MITSPTVWKQAQGRRGVLAPDDNEKKMISVLSELVLKMAIEGKQIRATHGAELLCYPSATVRNKLSPLLG